MADENKVWTCKIGEVNNDRLPGGGLGDKAMRDAVEAAYMGLTGEEPTFTFSGWGGRLSEAERAVVEDRLPGATMLNRLGGKVYLPDLWEPLVSADVELVVHDGAESATVRVRLPDASLDVAKVEISGTEDLVSVMIEATRRAWQHALDTGPDPTRIPDSPGPHAGPIDPPRPPDDRPVS